MNDPAEDGTQDNVIVVRSLGLRTYEPVWRAMQRFTEERGERTADEIWLTEHPGVFTLGLNASREHLLETGDIPVVQIDRGGQATFHGPGQLMIYPLLDLKRNNLGVRDLVTALEQSVVDLASSLGIEAVARPDAPGVYVDGKKLASIGLRVRRGSSYHGMALNIDIDLEPFTRINPCGYADLEMTDLRTLGIDDSLSDIATHVQDYLLQHLKMTGRPVAVDSPNMPWSNDER